MYKITEEQIRDYLANNKAELFPTRVKLCIPVINRIYQKMINGIKFLHIQVYAKWIIDGHHRYISALLANKHLAKVPANRTSSTQPIEWLSVEYDTNDWDNEATIEKFNTADAVFNNIPLSEIIKMTK